MKKKDPPIYGLEEKYLEIIGNIHEDQFRNVTKNENERVTIGNWLKQEIDNE